MRSAVLPSPLVFLPSYLSELVKADGLKGPLLIFEEAMKHCKMRQGWAASSESGNQRAVWIKDIGAATTPSQMLYQVKVLTWFIGRRQKARSSLKIAPIFSCEMRLTRARAGIVKVASYIHVCILHARYIIYNVSV